MITPSDNQTKKCPFCGEDILSIAIKCKYCHSMLDEDCVGLSTTADSLNNLINQRPNSVMYVSWLIYLKVFLAVIVLASSQKEVWDYLRYIDADNSGSVDKYIYGVSFMVFLVLLWVVLIAYKINQGKNWARVTYLTLLTIGFIFILIGIVSLLVYGGFRAYMSLVFYSYKPFDYFIAIFSWASDFVILYLLMSSSVRYWFASIKRIESSLQKQEIDELPTGQKKCPFCRKLIDSDAMKCPYCNTDIAFWGDVVRFEHKPKL